MQRTKIFTAGDEGAALQKAVAFFACDEKELYREVIVQSGEEKEAEVLFILGSGASRPAGMSASFSLFYEADGVYLELYPKYGNGEEKSLEAALNFIAKKRVLSISGSAVAQLYAKSCGRIKIAPAQEEQKIPEGVQADISETGMEASISLEPPEEGGRLLEISDIKEALNAADVVFGIDDAAIERALSERSYGCPYVVARARPAEKGEDGRLEFHFRRELTGVPKIDKNDRADYRTLDIFEPVKEGQLLVTLTPATAGVPGSTVKGGEIIPKAGRAERLPRSKNTFISEDKLKIFAAKSGKVEFRSNVVSVSDTYVVKGNCDMSVGNIDFDGIVIIEGSVIPGMTVRASGSIIIGGVVDASSIISGGSIELTLGIQGNDKGLLQAADSIKALYIMRARAVAGRDITADMVTHSNLEVGNSLILKGQRGALMGGTTRVARELTAQDIGSVSNTPTSIEVGLMPEKRARIQFLTTELPNKKTELDKILKTEMYLSKGSVNMTEENKLKMQAAIAASKQEYMRVIAEFTEELESLNREAEQVVNGKIHVLGTVYSDTKISIGTATYKVVDPIPYATFRLHDKEITFLPCEAGRR